VYEKYDADLTFVILPMISMVPEHINEDLAKQLGDAYHATDELQRLILVLAHQFTPISNSEEIAAYSTKHPRNIGELKKMVQKGWLVFEGRGRGTRYRLNRKNLQNEEGGQVGGQAALEGGQAGGQAGKTPDITLYDWHMLQALSLGDKSAKELKSFQTNSSNVSGAFKVIPLEHALQGSDDAEIEEAMMKERALLYVAATRAKKTITVTTSAKAPSPFL
jgi:hypothetical protein